MKIDSKLVKELRTEKNWSQDHLANACGLTLRTIQRLENSGKSSLDSIKALAAVFEIAPKQLILTDEDVKISPFELVIANLRQYQDFAGKASRAEYWWFFLAVLIVAAIAQIVHQSAYLIVMVLATLPLIASGTRRLNDIGKSGWWQCLFLVPFGFVVVFYLLSLPSKVTLKHSPL